MVYEYPTNFSNGTSVSSVAGIFQYGQYVTNGTFAYGILIVIWLIVFVSGMALNSRKSMMAASFITFIFSVYFMRLSMISVPIVVMLAIVFVVTALLGSKEGSGV